MSHDTPITREHAARLLGTSERHVRRLIQQGRLPTEPDARGTRLLLRSTVLAYADAAREAVTQLEAATLIGVGRRTIRRMLDDGRLQAAPTSGGHDRVTRQSIDQHLARVPFNPDTSGHKSDTMGHTLVTGLIDILSEPDTTAPTTRHDARDDQEHTTDAHAEAEAFVALLDPPASEAAWPAASQSGPPSGPDHPRPTLDEAPARPPPHRLRRPRTLVAVALLLIVCVAVIAVAMVATEGRSHLSARSLPTPGLLAPTPPYVPRRYRLHAPRIAVPVVAQPRARGGRARLLPQPAHRTPVRQPRDVIPESAPARPSRAPLVPASTGAPPVQAGCGLFVPGRGLC